LRSVDYDEHNRVVGIEIEDASKFIDLSRLELRDLPIANLVFNCREFARGAFRTGIGNFWEVREKKTSNNFGVRI